MENMVVGSPVCIDVIKLTLESFKQNACVLDKDLYSIPVHKVLNNLEDPRGF